MGTNASNLLRFFQLEMVKMSVGIYGLVDNKDCGMLSPRYETLRRCAWRKKTKRYVVACSRAGNTDYQLMQMDNVVKQSKEA